MTAMTQETKAKRPFLLSFVAFMILMASLPPLNSHAIKRHGLDAWKAWRFISNYEPDDDNDDDKLWRGRSEDGRDFYILRLPRVSGRTIWAIVIVGGGGAYMVTAFLCSSKNTVRKIKRMCKD